MFTGDQGLSQVLETGWPKSAIVKFLLGLLFRVLARILKMQIERENESLEDYAVSA